eukprot:25509-Prymnesium_polylepis.1
MRVVPDALVRTGVRSRAALPLDEMHTIEGSRPRDTSRVAVPGANRLAVLWSDADGSAHAPCTLARRH